MGDKKDDRLEIRLSKGEKEQLKRKAAERGLSVSHYIRMLIVSHYIRMLVETKEEPDEKD